MEFLGNNNQIKNVSEKTPRKKTKNNSSINESNNNINVEGSVESAEKPKKKKISQTKQKLKSLTEEYNALLEEKENNEKTYADEINKLKSEIENLNKSNEMKLNNYNSLINQLNTALENMNNVEQENSNYEKKIKELNEKIEILEANNNNNITNNDEDTINKIKELEKKNSELENEYMTKITQLNDYIITLETGQGVSEQMEKLKNKIKQQENILISLTNQLKEYQSKTDNIINANGNNDNENILTLIKEVKSIRQRILDIVTYNNKIDNFDEFIKILENIKNNINYEENMNKLNELIEHYKKNNDKSILDLYDQFYK